MKIDGSLQSVMQGVSQQPERVRLPGQCSKQDNAMINPSDGWQKRQPTNAISMIRGLIDENNTAFHDYVRDEVESWLFCVTSTAKLIVNSRTGALATFNGIVNPSYIQTANPSKNLRFTTVGDYTMVVNKLVEVKMAGDVKTSTSGLLVNVKKGEYGRTYTVTADGHVMTHQVPNRLTGATDNADVLSTKTIATALVTSFGTVSGYTITRKDHVIYLKRNDNAMMDVSSSDDQNGTGMSVVQSIVDDLDDLPKFAPSEFKVKVASDVESSAGDYYIEFTYEEAGGTFGSEGTWRETVANGIPYKPDYLTWPHAFIRLPDMTFWFGPLDGRTLTVGAGTLKIERWRDRTIGDDLTNPFPSFINKTIRDIGIFADRLYLLSDENLIMSVNSSYWDYFYKTSLEILDTDPIDIFSSGTTINILEAAIPLNRDLVVFSAESQFRMLGNTVLTPKTATLGQATAFNASTTSYPVAAGNVIFFPISYGAFGGVQEFYTDSNVDTNDARPITDHINRYIKGDITRMLASSNYNILLCLSSNSEHIYVYKYLWQGQERVQSAWGTWILQDGIKIKYIYLIEAKVYIVLTIGTSTYIEVIDLTELNDIGLEFSINLDGKGKYPSVDTTLTVPYETDINDTNLQCIQGEGCPYPGLNARILSRELVPITGGTGTKITFYDSMENGDVYYGRKYLTTYEPTQIFIRDKQGIVVSTGRFSLMSYVINFTNTGYFKTTISSKNNYYPDSIQEYTGYILGSSFVVGEVSITTGTYRVSVSRESKDTILTLSSDSYLPFTLLDIEYTAQYTKSGRRI